MQLSTRDTIVQLKKKRKIPIHIVEKLIRIRTDLENNDPRDCERYVPRENLAIQLDEILRWANSNWVKRRDQRLEQSNNTD